MKKLTLTLCAVIGLAACEGGPNIQDKTEDRGIDGKDLMQLQAGIWIDPNGCDHWIIDDGFEGYLSQRLNRHGRPVCSGAPGEGAATGDFKGGSNIPDVF